MRGSHPDGAEEELLHRGTSLDEGPPEPLALAQLEGLLHRTGRLLERPERVTSHRIVEPGLGQLVADRRSQRAVQARPQGFDGGLGLPVGDLEPGQLDGHLQRRCPLDLGLQDRPGPVVLAALREQARLARADDGLDEVRRAQLASALFRGSQHRPRPEQLPGSRQQEGSHQGDPHIERQLMGTRVRLLRHVERVLRLRQLVPGEPHHRHGCVRHGRGGGHGPAAPLGQLDRRRRPLFRRPDAPPDGLEAGQLTETIQRDVLRAGPPRGSQPLLEMRRRGREVPHPYLGGPQVDEGRSPDGVAPVPHGQPVRRGRQHLTGRQHHGLEVPADPREVEPNVRHRLGEGPPPFRRNQRFVRLGQP